MARGRMINQSVATDKRLNGLSIQAELVYLKTIPHLDRDGLILGDPLVLWGKVCPRRPELMREIANIVDEWIAAELVIDYETDEGTILYFTGFVKNQIGMRYDREGVSTLPTPPGYVRTESGLAPQTNTPMQDDDGASPEQVRSKSARARPRAAGSLSLNLRSSSPTPSLSNDGETADDDDDISLDAVCDCYEENMTDKVTKRRRNELERLRTQHGGQTVIDGILLTVDSGGKSFRYLETTLQNRANGIGPPGKARDPTGGAAWEALNQELPDYMKDTPHG